MPAQKNTRRLTTAAGTLLAAVSLGAVSPVLAADAYDWSVNLSRLGTLQHQDGPDDFRDGWDSWGENAAYNYSDSAAKMFQQWKNSPGHRANMLSEDFDTYGVGFHTDANGRPYGTTVFYRVGGGSTNLPDTWASPAAYFNGEAALPLDGSTPKPGPFIDASQGHSF